MPKVMIVPRELAKFSPKFRDVLDNANLEVVTLPPADANLPTDGRNCSSRSRGRRR